jgi:hypothetical protein
LKATPGSYFRTRLSFCLTTVLGAFAHNLNDCFFVFTSKLVHKSPSMSMRDLIHGEAELDEEENDESFDEETGEERPKKKRQVDLDDSSEEEEDDDDEEAARLVCGYLDPVCLWN